MKNILKNFGYEFDESRAIWIRPEYNGISYSDGDETEIRISKILQNSLDNSVLSTELMMEVTDWASLYHLSSLRANILRPFEDRLKGEILEIGAGCGAITRFLGEQGGNVLALEGSPRRAAIARSRTRDLKNVTVLSEKFDAFKTDHKFDVITLIGVLEYANMFTSGNDAAVVMLKYARQLLKPDGRLIIAIENQLGLKYFAGAPEDHLNVPMYGVEGRYKSDEPQTFGKKDLELLLKKSGFCSTRFMAPFPDYKLPCSIITEEGFASPNFDAAAFAWQSSKRDPQLPLFTGFSLELAWPEIIKNGLGLEMANSFLVEASNKVESAHDALAYHFSAGRKKEYCREAIFRQKKGDQISVVYRPLENDGGPKGFKDEVINYLPIAESDYVFGKTLSWDFIKIVTADGWTFKELGEFFKSYLNVLANFLVEDGFATVLDAPNKLLPGKYFDLVPQNIIKYRNKSFRIDQEWALKNQVEVGFLIFRGTLLMMSSITRFGKGQPYSFITRENFILEIFKSLGYAVDAIQITNYLQKEAQIQHEITGLPHGKFLEWHPDNFLPIKTFSEIYAETKEYSVQVRKDCEEQTQAKDRQIIAKDQHIDNLDQQIISKNQNIDNLDQQIIAKDQHIDNLDQQIISKNQNIDNLDQQIIAKDQHIDNLDQQIIAKDRHIENLNNQISLIMRSISWKLTKPLRIFGVMLRKVRRAFMFGLLAYRRFGGVISLSKKVIAAYRHGGVDQILYKYRSTMYYPQDNSSRELNENPDPNDYSQWFLRYGSISEGAKKDIQIKLKTLKVFPKISVVLPVYRPSLIWLTEAIESIKNQIYPNWELCIADDASYIPEVTKLLEGYQNSDPRIKVVFCKKNGHISAASNAALELATGDWMALVDHDDLLTEDALYRVVEAINHHSTAKLVYSDEAKIDELGNKFSPYFKCSWNRDLFYSHNLISHLGTYEMSLVRKIGGFRVGYEGSQDHDLALRFIENIQDDQIIHIPRVLYFWRAHAESTASSADAKSYAQVAGEKAINEHFERIGVAAKASSGRGGYRISYDLPEALPLVSLIIPTRDAFSLVKQCIESIIKKTSYKNYEIILVDNNSTDPISLEYFKSLGSLDNVRVIRDERDFNYSALNNNAVKFARGEIIGLINNDIEVINPDWLNEMVSIALQPGVGAVGAKLLYPNNTIQHGGVILGLGGVAEHSHKNFPRASDGYFGRAGIISSFSAVTGACLLVRKTIFNQVGGLNEQDLAIAFNDVDFCLRVRELGYRNVWTPYAELYHHESATRGTEDTPEKQQRFQNEVKYMMQKWAHILQADPAYSPNLTLESPKFSYAWPPRV